MLSTVDTIIARRRAAAERVIALGVDLGVPVDALATDELLDIGDLQLQVLMSQSS